MAWAFLKVSKLELHAGGSLALPDLVSCNWLITVHSSSADVCPWAFRDSEELATATQQPELSRQ